MDKIEFFEKMINSFNELNLKFDNLNNAINFVSSNNYFDKYFPALIGFIGVIIGSLISYFANKSISQIERNSRLAIQRKNLIYAPLYKELLQLSDYIYKNKHTCYLNIIQEGAPSEWEEEYYHDDERHKSGFFIIWNDMKKDIRKNYIPSKIANNLNDISNNINIYLANRDKLDEKFKKLCNKYKINELYGEADRIRYKKEKCDSTINLETPAFLFYKRRNYINHVKRIYDRYGLSEPEYKKFKLNLERIFKNLAKEVNRKDLLESYNLLCKSITYAREEINKLIYYITNKYELGKELEQYE